MRAYLRNYSSKCDYFLILVFPCYKLIADQSSLSVPFYTDFNVVFNIIFFLVKFIFYGAPLSSGGKSAFHSILQTLRLHFEGLQFFALKKLFSL